MLGVVHTFGLEIEVRMPTVGQILELTQQGRNNLQAIVIAATGLDWKTFSDLPLPSGTAVINLLQPCFMGLPDFDEKKRMIN